MSQQQQYGGHLCPKSPEEVIFTVTLRSLSPRVGVTVPSAWASAGFTTAMTGNPILGVNVGPR